MRYYNYFHCEAGTVNKQINETEFFHYSNLVHVVIDGLDEFQKLDKSPHVFKIHLDRRKTKLHVIFRVLDRDFIHEWFAAKAAGGGYLRKVLKIKAEKIDQNPPEVTLRVENEIISNGFADPLDVAKYQPVRRRRTRPKRMCFPIDDHRRRNYEIDRFINVKVAERSAL